MLTASNEVFVMPAKASIPFLDSDKSIREITRGIDNIKKLNSPPETLAEDFVDIVNYYKCVRINFFYNIKSRVTSLFDTTVKIISRSIFL
jgi:hypothetical protein